VQGYVDTEVAAHLGATPHAVRQARYATYVALRQWGTCWPRLPVGMRTPGYVSQLVRRGTLCWETAPKPGHHGWADPFFAPV
jgi:hypothetical protein